LGGEEGEVRIIIVGAGDTGLDLARKLSDRENVDLVVVDSDPKRCEAVSNELDALVLNGDGTDPEILKQAQISQADVLIVLTGSDPLNTVVAMLGRRFDVKKIMVKLNGLALRSALMSIGVYKIITPKISAADEILSAVYGYDRLNLWQLARGGLRLVALRAEKAKGKKISDLEMPEGAHLIALLRGNDVRIPHPKTGLEEDDELLVLVESERDLTKLKDQLIQAPEA
jgi:trk system potassium uptake protein TrkA